MGPLDRLLRISRYSTQILSIESSCRFNPVSGTEGGLPINWIWNFPGRMCSRPQHPSKHGESLGEDSSSHCVSYFTDDRFRGPESPYGVGHRNLLACRYDLP